jgi:TonB-linked SusC/RagA family outer membrane protein
MFLCMLVVAFNLYAQNRTITGKVLDEKQIPVPGATVSGKGTRTAVVTNVEGNYSISLPASTTTLVITAVNFATKEVTIGSQTTINVSLVPSAQDLSDVVVVGYGSGKKRSDVVGSVSTVSGDRVAGRPTPNMIEGLQGQVPGLQVFSNSGEPSATPTIRINGVGSLTTSSTPLFVLDGIVVDPGSVLSLNPWDVESVSVLKDAAATSIYGARAANGVIFYTTKKGNPNRPQINLVTRYGVSNLIKQTEDLFNSLLTTDQFVNMLLVTGQQTQAQINNTLAGGVAKLSNNTKWYKTYYKENVPLYQADLNLSGGSGKTQYYVAGGYTKQEGLAYRSDYERFTLRTNINTNVTNWLRFGINAFGGYDKRQTNPYGTNNLNRGLALLTQPWYSPNDSTGKRYDFIPGVNRYHPEYLQEKIQSQGNNLQFNPTGYIEVNPLKGLIVRTQAGLDFYDYRTSSLRLPSYLGSLNNGQVTEDFARGALRTFTNTAEYKFNVSNDHSFTVLGGQEFIKNDYSYFVGQTSGQTDDRLVLLSSATQNTVSQSSKSQYSFFSYFGRLDYAFKSKYLLQGSLRRDQSSRFGKNVQGATFWSAGAAWKLKEENFMKNMWWVNDLRVKATIGTSGNSDIGDYAALAKVGANGVYNSTTGWGAADAGNPDLTWEKQRQINVGFQATIFKKLQIDAEFFQRRTTSMLMSVPYPFTSGFSSVLSNVGVLNNHGVNVGLKYDVLTKRDGFLSVYGNFGWVEQKVAELFQGRKSYSIPNTGVTWAVNQGVTFYYPIFSHVDPATGMPLWYVPNAGEGNTTTKKDPTQVTSVFSSNALLQNTGIKRYAPFNGGFGLQGGYKGFVITVDFSYSQGKYLINNDRYFYENPFQFAGYNQSVNVLDFWKKPGDVARFPKAGVQFTQFDSRLIENASFVRLKNLSVGYNVPTRYLGKVIKGIGFDVTFRNLITWTKYSGPDPEVDSNLSLGANPNTKQTSFGLRFTF